MTTTATIYRQAAYEMGYQAARSGILHDGHWLQIVFENMCHGDPDTVADLFDAYGDGVEDGCLQREYALGATLGV